MKADYVFYPGRAIATGPQRHRREGANFQTRHPVQNFTRVEIWGMVSYMEMLLTVVSYGAPWALVVMGVVLSVKHSEADSIGEC